MTKAEFNQVVRLAETSVETGYPPADYAILEGCAFPDFKPVTVPLKLAVGWLRWQALQFNGQWDTAELANCAIIARKKIRVVGGEL